MCSYYIMRFYKNIWKQETNVISSVDKSVVNVVFPMSLTNTFSVSCLEAYPGELQVALLL